MNIDIFLLHRQPSLQPTQQLCGVVGAPHFPIEKVEGPCHMDVSFAHGKRLAHYGPMVVKYNGPHYFLTTPTFNPCKYV